MASNKQSRHVYITPLYHTLLVMASEESGVPIKQLVDEALLEWLKTRYPEAVKT